MVRDQSPELALGLGFFDDDCKPFEKRVTILIISEKLPPSNSPSHNMLEVPGSIKSGLAWHFVS